MTAKQQTSRKAGRIEAEVDDEPQVDIEDLVEEVIAEEEEIEEDVVADDDDASGNLEDLDPTTPLWEGGPLAGQAQAWKEQYGDIYVSRVDPYLERYVIWRPLNRHEYRALVKEMENSISSGQVSQAEANLNNEEAIAELCILFPRYSRHAPASFAAGIPSAIAQEVMENSGFVTTEVRKL